MILNNSVFSCGVRRTVKFKISSVEFEECFSGEHDGR
jgi:hypothetical protein